VLGVPCNTFAGDLLQLGNDIPSEVSRCSGCRLPTLVCHGDHYNIKHNRSLVAEEHLISQVVPVYPAIHGGPSVGPFVNNAFAYTGSQLKRLAGNGYNVSVYGWWFWFHISALRQRRLINTLPYMPQVPELDCDHTSISSDNEADCDEETNTIVTVYYSPTRDDALSIASDCSSVGDLEEALFGPEPLDFADVANLFEDFVQESGESSGFGSPSLRAAAASTEM
jgi:hypothetical protein